MDQDNPISKPDFNHASNGAVQDAGTIALMIDLQQGCLLYLKRDEADAYLNHMRGVLDDLRERNIPVGWVTIGDVKNELHEPERGNALPRDDTELHQLGFFGHHEHADLFKDFMETHGPKKNEVVFRKEGFSALGDEEPGLKEYLKDIDKVILSGGMAAYCVGTTACDAVRLGHETVVATDTVIGWPGGQRSQNYLEEGATWRGEDHALKIAEEYDEVAKHMTFMSYADSYLSEKTPVSSFNAKNTLDF